MAQCFSASIRCKRHGLENLWAHVPRHLEIDAPACCRRFEPENLCPAAVRRRAAIPDVPRIHPVAGGGVKVSPVYYEMQDFRASGQSTILVHATSTVRTFPSACDHFAGNCCVRGCATHRRRSDGSAAGNREQSEGCKYSDARFYGVAGPAAEIG